MPDSPTLTAEVLTAEVVRNALELIDACADERVLLVGETIRDEYRYVRALRGKPSKEFVLACEERGMEAWAGGVVAAHGHAAGFCKAEMLSTWVSVTKTRYVDGDSGRKLFEVQVLPEIALLEVPDLGAWDTVAVADFGHGLVGRREADGLCKAAFLAVACQTNAANHGFNLVTKYRSPDYVVIDEPEARLAAHDRDSPIEEVMESLVTRLSDYIPNGRCTLVVTHGRHGSYGLGRGEFLHMPALSDRVVDTMGAGDAFFAVTACMARRAPEFGGLRTLLAIGNAAGALKCETLGHRAGVTKAALVERLRRV